jgi:hypothetical protein
MKISLVISPVILALYIILLFIILLVVIKTANELFIQYQNAKLNNVSYGYQEVFKDTTNAVELMARLHIEMTNFVNDLKIKYPKNDGINRLAIGFNRLKIEEAPNEDDSTSYTVNKGDLMALCLREKNGDHPFHNYNTLQFVIIHEMAHIMSISEGHNDEFVTNFQFLLRDAHKLGYYQPVDYRTNPITYCGLRVTNNPFF